MIDKAEQTTKESEGTWGVQSEETSFVTPYTTTTEDQEKDESSKFHCDCVLCNGVNC